MTPAEFRRAVYARARRERREWERVAHLEATVLNAMGAKIEGRAVRVEDMIGKDPFAPKPASGVPTSRERLERALANVAASSERLRARRAAERAEAEATESPTE